MSATMHQSRARAQAHRIHLQTVVHKLPFARFDPGHTLLEFHDLTLPEAAIRLSWDTSQGLVCFIQVRRLPGRFDTLFLGPTSLCFELPTLKIRLAEFRARWAAAESPLRSHFRLAAAMAVICQHAP